MALTSHLHPRNVASGPERLRCTKPQDPPSHTACAQNTDHEPPSPTAEVSVVEILRPEAAPGQAGKQVSRMTMHGPGKPIKEGDMRCPEPRHPPRKVSRRRKGGKKAFFREVTDLKENVILIDLFTGVVGHSFNQKKKKKTTFFVKVKDGFWWCWC